MTETTKKPTSDVNQLAEDIKNLSPADKLRAAAGMLDAATEPGHVEMAIRIGRMGVEEAEFITRLHFHKNSAARRPSRQEADASSDALAARLTRHTSTTPIDPYEEKPEPEAEAAATASGICRNCKGEFSHGLSDGLCGDCIGLGAPQPEPAQPE